MATKKLPRDMGFFRFWGESLKRCFSLGWLIFGIVSTAMPAGITLIQHWFFALANVPLFKTVSEYQAEIQVGIALIFLASYLAYAPFRLYKEANDDVTIRIRDAEQNVEKSEQQIGELQSKLDLREHRRNLADRLAYAMEEGRLLGPNHSKEEDEKWIHGTVNPLLNEIGYGAFARFNAATHEARSLFPASPAVPVLNARLKILNQFIEELTRPA
jgi:hypothetical protein